MNSILAAVVYQFVEQSGESFSCVNKRMIPCSKKPPPHTKPMG